MKRSVLVLSLLGLIGLGAASCGSGANGTGSNGAAVAGTASCAGQGSLCIGLKWVNYKDPASGQPVGSPAQTAVILNTINSLWGKCGVQFQVEDYEEVNPADYQLAYGSSAQNQLDQIRADFHSNSQMLVVTTGPWGATKNAWTTMPGDGVEGAIMEASIVNYGAGIIYAHELGHYMGLDHVADNSNLMDAIIYTNSTQITDSQCQTVQQTIRGYWAAKLR